MSLSGRQRRRGAQDLLGHLITSGSPKMQVSGVQLFILLKQKLFSAFTLGGVHTTVKMTATAVHGDVK